MLKMASKQIKERARSAFLNTKDLLLEEDGEIWGEEYTDEEDDDDDDESENENCNEDGDVASKSGENGTDQNENDGEKTLATKSDKDPPKSKKSSKGVSKTAKSLFNAAKDPFGIGKIDWKLGLNLGFQASSQKGRGEKGTDDNQRSGERSGDASSLLDEKKIKILVKETVSLAKLANKYLDGYFRLREKVLDLSKVEGQLSTLQAENEGLKAELLQLQKLHQGFKINAETQNAEHRAEVKRLKTELTTAKECMEKMKAASEEQLNETCRLKKELETITKQNEDLVKQTEQTETTLRSEVKKLELCLLQTEKEKTEQAERNLEIQGNMQAAEQLIRESNAKNVKLERNLRDTESEKDRINSQLEASNAKVAELKRAIQILESDPFTTTTAQAHGGGSFSCPICGAQFSSLANMQIHAEDCNG